MPAHFNSKAAYTVNHIYAIMTTNEWNTQIQLQEIERFQILTILLLAQTNRFMAGYLLTENNVMLLKLKVRGCDYSKANLIFYLYILKKIVLTKYQFSMRIQSIV